MYNTNAYWIVSIMFMFEFIDNVTCLMCIMCGRQTVVFLCLGDDQKGLALLGCYEVFR